LVQLNFGFSLATNIILFSSAISFFFLENFVCYDSYDQKIKMTQYPKMHVPVQELEIFTRLWNG